MEKVIYLIILSFTLSIHLLRADTELDVQVITNEEMHISIPHRMLLKNPPENIQQLGVADHELFNSLGLIVGIGNLSLRMIDYAFDQVAKYLQVNPPQPWCLPGTFTGVARVKLEAIRQEIMNQSAQETCLKLGYRGVSQTPGHLPNLKDLEPLDLGPDLQVEHKPVFFEGRLITTDMLNPSSIYTDYESHVDRFLFAFKHYAPANYFFKTLWCMKNQ